MGVGGLARPRARLERARREGAPKREEGTLGEKEGRVVH